MLDSFLPSQWLNDNFAEERHRARVLVGLAVVLVPILIVRAWAFVDADVPEAALRPMLVMLGIFAVLALVKWRASLVLSTTILCGILYGAGVSLALSRGPNFSNPLMAMCGLPVVALFIAGRRAGLAWTAVHVVVVIGFQSVQPALGARVDVVPLSARSTVEVTGALGFLIALILLGYAFERSRKLESGIRERAEHQRNLAMSEVALMRVDRYSVLGQLAATMAHEVNNSLQILAGNLDELRRSGRESDEEVEEVISDMEHAVDSIRRLTSDLGDYTRGSYEDSESVELSHLIDTALHMANARLRRVASIERDLTDESMVVELPRVPIQQILLNLLLNAADALADSKTGRGVIGVEAHRLSAYWARVVVSDDGVGMTERVRERALEPFFSTKEQFATGGTGLAASKSILEDLGGRFHLESAPQKGTRVTVDLPLKQNAQPSVPPVRCVGLADINRLRILLVDDDAVVGKTLKLVLRDHDTVFALGGAAALGVLEKDTSFDAIILDVTMPEMDGMETYARILERWPRLAGLVVLLTGGANNRRLREFVQNTHLPLLTKPVDEEQCARVLQFVVTGMAEPRDFAEHPFA